MPKAEPKMSVTEHMERVNKKPIEVLVVDDEKCVREVLKCGLSTKGVFSVKEAANGKEALEKVARDKFDIILLDVTMPVMDGLQTYKSLKDNPETRYIPVILLTARPYKDIVRNMSIRADEYMEKPFDLEELYARINRINESEKK